MSREGRDEAWNSGIAPAERAPAESVLYELAKEALIEKRRSRRWSLFFRFSFLALLLLAILAVLFSGFSELPGNDSKHTAIVEIKGLIADQQPTNAETTVLALQAALRNKNSVGLILRINSPGGSPVQAGIIFEEILRLRVQYPEKPIHAVVTDISASGGYYIAAAADRIYANQASIIGSIGVRMDSFGFTGTLEKLGVERRLLTAGDNKAMLDPFLPIDKTHEMHLQKLLNQIHQQFVSAVRKGRGERLNETEDMFSGLFWSGDEALELGLIDELATEHFVAREVLGAERILDYTYREGFAERVLGQIAGSISGRFLSLLASPGNTY